MSSTTEAMEEKNDYTEKSFIYQIFFSSETNGYYIIALVIFYVPLSLYKKKYRSSWFWPWCLVPFFEDVFLKTKYVFGWFSVVHIVLILYNYLKQNTAQVWFWQLPLITILELYPMKMWKVPKYFLSGSVILSKVKQMKYYHGFIIHISWNRFPCFRLETSLLRYISMCRYLKKIPLSEREYTINGGFSTGKFSLICVFF